MRKFQFLSSFFIKIIAIVTMTLDHLAIFLRAAYPYSVTIGEIYNVFRGFGRLALPLFIFMIVEGVIHTKNIKRYFIRLGIPCILISAFLMIITYWWHFDGSTFISGAGNIFIDLILVALSVWLLKQDNKYLKLLILLPLALSIASFSVKCYENAGLGIVHWYPTFLYLQADWFSLGMGILFFLSYKAADTYIDYASSKGYSASYWDDEGNKRLLVAVIQFFTLFVINALFYAFKYLWIEGVFWDVDIQLISIFSGAFILCYNGKRGYNARWFQIGAYVYYPLHLIIIALITLL